MRARLLILSVMAPVVMAPAGAQDTSPAPPESPAAAEQPAEPAKPVIEKIDDTRFRIGKVTFDRKTREIRFPTKVNMTEGQLEFLIVHENGKVHESLLSTDVSPTHINLAFTLLRYPASRELYPLPSETGGASNKYPPVPDDVKAGARIAIEVEWIENGTTHHRPANEWVQHLPKEDTMPSGPWVYGGSEVFEGKYVPESTGDICAIFVSPSAMINYPGEDDQNDDVWLPFPKRVPPLDTEVTVIIKPFPNSSATIKP